MALNLAQVPFKLTPEDMGAGDWQAAVNKGMMFPHQLEAAKLANALNEFKRQQESNRSQYYPRLNLAETLKAEAEPAEMQARTGLYGQQANEIRQLLPGRVQELGLKNKNYEQDIQSQIALRQAQGGLAGAEAAKSRFQVENPQYMSPEGALISQALIQRNQPSQPSENVAQLTTPNMQGQNAQYQQYSNQPQFPVDSQRYNPNAMAFNPPELPSPTGNAALDNVYFKKFGMSPSVQAQLDLAQNNAKLYQDENIKRNAQNNQQAVFSNQSTVDAYKFLDALEKTRSIEHGPVFGRIAGVSDAAQEADAAGNNMVSSAAKLFQNEKAVHAADIALQQEAKPSRLRNKDVAFDLAQGIIAKNNRVKERQAFDSYGTQQNIKPEIRDALFSKYETERPYINTETKMPNDSYNGTWKDYLTPEAVNAYVAGINYTPSSQAVLQGMNWSKSDLKNIKTWASRNGLSPDDFDKKNLYKLAKNENMTLAQLKSWLMSRGALKNGA